MNTVLNNKKNDAIVQLKKLDFAKALTLFYQALTEQPNDLSLIDQIYVLESRKKSNDGYSRIIAHIFSCENKSEKYHSTIIKAYKDSKLRDNFNPLQSLDAIQTFNLLFHLGQTGYQQDIEKLLILVKSKLSEHTQTPLALLILSEQLINKGLYLKARKELEFLMIYYTEADTQIAAEKLIKRVNSQLNSAN